MTFTVAVNLEWEEDSTLGCYKSTIRPLLLRTVGRSKLTFACPTLNAINLTFTNLVATSIETDYITIIVDNHLGICVFLSGSYARLCVLHLAGQVTGSSTPPNSITIDNPRVAITCGIPHVTPNGTITTPFSIPCPSLWTIRVTGKETHLWRELRWNEYIRSLRSSNDIAIEVTCLYIIGLLRRITTLWHNLELAIRCTRWQNVLISTFFHLVNSHYTRGRSKEREIVSVSCLCSIVLIAILHYGKAIRQLLFSQAGVTWHVDAVFRRVAGRQQAKGCNHK